MSHYIMSMIPDPDNHIHRDGKHSRQARVGYPELTHGSVQYAKGHSEAVGYITKL